MRWIPICALSRVSAILSWAHQIQKSSYQPEEADKFSTTQSRVHKVKTHICEATIQTPRKKEKKFCNLEVELANWAACQVVGTSWAVPTKSQQFKTQWNKHSASVCSFSCPKSRRKFFFWLKGTTICSLQHGYNREKSAETSSVTLVWSRDHWSSSVLYFFFSASQVSSS